jgi:hypothetical protein
MDALKSIEEEFEKLFITLGYPDFTNNKISNFNAKELNYYLMLRYKCLSIIRSGFVEKPKKKKIFVFEYFEIYNEIILNIPPTDSNM